MSQQFQEIIKRAKDIQTKYDQLNAEEHGRAWSVSERAMGMGGDYGQLVKLIMAKEGRRSYSGDISLDDALRHEISDCLWSIITIADMYNIDLEKAFVETMDELDARIERKES